MHPHFSNKTKHLYSESYNSESVTQNWVWCILTLQKFKTDHKKILMLTFIALGFRWICGSGHWFCSEHRGFEWSCVLWQWRGKQKEAPLFAQLLVTPVETAQFLSQITSPCSLQSILQEFGLIWLVPWHLIPVEQPSLSTGGSVQKVTNE